MAEDLMPAMLHGVAGNAGKGAGAVAEDLMPAMAQGSLGFNAGRGAVETEGGADFVAGQRRQLPGRMFTLCPLLRCS